MSGFVAASGLWVHAQEPTRVIKDEDAPGASTEVVPPVDLGATLETTPEGLTVVDVDTISPLRDAGVKPGDYIKSAAGRNVLTPEGLFRVLNEIDGGTEVQLKLDRKGKDFDVTMVLPKDHHKVMVDQSANNAPSLHADRNRGVRGRMNDAQLMQQLLANQQRQQAQINYLNDALQRLAQAAGVNNGVLGTPPYGFGPGFLGGLGGVGGVGAGNGNGCFCGIGTDAQGHAVIGFFQDGTAAGILSIGANQIPVIGPTTIVTQTSSTTATGAVITDRNGDGLPDGPDLDGDGFPPASNTGAASTAGSCACPLGTDGNGNSVIGVTQQGAALAVVGTNAGGQPMLAETTFTFPTTGNQTGPVTDTQTPPAVPESPLPTLRPTTSRKGTQTPQAVPQNPNPTLRPSTKP